MQLQPILFETMAGHECKVSVCACISFMHTYRHVKKKTRTLQDPLNTHHRAVQRQSMSQLRSPLRSMQASC